MSQRTEKELEISDYISRVIPVLDVLFVLWVAYTSTEPWKTAGIQLTMPILGLTSLYLLKGKGRWSFYVIGVCTITPAFLLNYWGGPDVPTWLPILSFITGGLLISQGGYEKYVVLLFSYIATFVPFYSNHLQMQFIITIMLTETAAWFLLERSLNFMTLQKKRISQQKNELEDKQKEILDSIHYAKRIQNSLLPTEKYIEKSFNRMQKIK